MVLGFGIPSLGKNLKVNGHRETVTTVLLRDLRPIRAIGLGSGAGEEFAGIPGGPFEESGNHDTVESGLVYPGCVGGLGRIRQPDEAQLLGPGPDGKKK